jgi:hypothetical protein
MKMPALNRPSRVVASNMAFTHELRVLKSRPKWAAASDKAMPSRLHKRITPKPDVRTGVSRTPL